MMLYHGTHRSNVASILALGLLGNEDGDPTHLQVRAADDARLGNTAAQQLEFVSMFFDDPRGMPGNSLGEVVCFEVDVDGLDLTEGWDGPGTFACAATIEPSRLRLMTETEVWSGEGLAVPISWKPSMR